jgi:3D (Asp-Asp-Asp) domain-containing protein
LFTSVAKLSTIGLGVAALYLGGAILTEQPPPRDIEAHAEETDDEPIEEQPIQRSFVASITAYSHESCAANPCRTRTGTVPRWGTAAVDPQVIPLGSHLLIEGFDGTIFTALDTGGAIKGYRLDIWMDSTQEALQWGVRQRLVTVLND